MAWAARPSVIAVTFTSPLHAPFQLALLQPCLGPVTSTSSSSSGRASPPFTSQSKRHDKRHKKQKTSILVFSTHSESPVSMPWAGEASIRVSLSSLSPVPVTNSASYCNVNGKFITHHSINLLTLSSPQPFRCSSRPLNLCLGHRRKFLETIRAPTPRPFLCYWQPFRW